MPAKDENSSEGLVTEGESESDDDWEAAEDWQRCHVESIIIECNQTLRELRETGICDKCRDATAHAKTLVCGGCRRLRHVTCEGKNWSTYWYCDHCRH